MVEHISDRSLLEQKAFGWDLKCEMITPGEDIGRDIELTNGPAGRDFKRVVGIENLKQALGIALTTGLGTDIFNVRYGFDGIRVLAEESDPVLARERVRVSVIQILRNDPRIRRILAVDFADERSDTAPSEEDIKQRELHIHASFETITAEQISLNLGKVVPYV